MTPEQINLTIGLLTVALMGYLIYRGFSLKDAKPLAQEVATVAQMAVMAAEEYGRTGQITTSEGKLKYAAAVFRRWIPLARGVSDADMLDAIHAFVPFTNNLGVRVLINKDENVPATLEISPGKTLP